MPLRVEPVEDGRADVGQLADLLRGERVEDLFAHERHVTWGGRDDRLPARVGERGVGVRAVRRPAPGSAWRRVVEDLQPNQRAWLRASDPVTLHESTAVIAVPNDFTRMQLEGRLRNQVEDVLECMKRDGSLAKLSEKWFGSKPAADDAENTPFPGYGVPGLPGYDPAPHEPRCG